MYDVVSDCGDFKVYHPFLPPFSNSACFSSHLRCSVCSYVHCHKCYLCPLLVGSKFLTSEGLSQGFWVEWNRVLSVHETNGCRFLNKAAPCSTCATLLSSKLDLFLLESSRTDIEFLQFLLLQFPGSRYPRSELKLTLKANGQSMRLLITEILKNVN
jgi:hypothetical protein